MFLLLSPFLGAHELTIEEKKRALEQESVSDVQGQMSSEEIFQRVLDIKMRLREIYQETQLALTDHESESGQEEQLQELAQQAKQLKRQLDHLQTIEPTAAYDGTAQWNSPGVTVADLISEYGLGDALYLVPPDIGKMKLSILSSLSVPTQEWPELLSHVLAQKGVGIRRINVYTKELYLLSEHSSFDMMTDELDHLWTLPENLQICFISDGMGSSVRELSATISRFFSTPAVKVTPFGSRIAIFASVQQVRQIARLQEYMADKSHEKKFRIVSLTKLRSEDAAKMLETLFEPPKQESKPIGSSALKKKRKDTSTGAGLTVIPLQYQERAAFFIAGHPKEVDAAALTLTRLEEEIQSSSGKRLFWYTCRHVSAQEIAPTASRVYNMLLSSAEGGSKEAFLLSSADLSLQGGVQGQGKELQPGNIAPLSVDTGMMVPSVTSNTGETPSFGEHIAVDVKSGSIMMVVEPHLLDKMRELLERLDQPKKMVRVDFLLFEKLITDAKEFGMNLFKLGAAADNVSQVGTSFRNPDLATGIFNFFLSRPEKPNRQAFDLAYNFLLSQDNVQINANPSSVTMNGTPAEVHLVDEISISTGPVEWESGGSTSLKDSYSRAQYGIIIHFTPQIHEGAGREDDSVTLDTKITFDTTSDSGDNRPKVTRRSIKNMVRVKDGETIILGGLRQTNQTDTQNQVPFLGEIPGFGKLFSYSKLNDRTTEMFIFITPRIVDESGEDWDASKRALLERRPGDSEIFLAKVLESKRRRQAIGLAKSMEAMFGRFHSEQRRTASYSLPSS